MIAFDVSHNGIAEFFDLPKCCWYLNFCTLKNSFHTFPEEKGIPIESSLGSRIAEVFMYYFEKDLSTQGHLFLEHVSYCHRHVDEILFLWTGPHQQAEEFLEFINSRFHSIVSINFLSIDKSRHEFGIFKKKYYRDI